MDHFLVPVCSILWVPYFSNFCYHLRIVQNVQVRSCSQIQNMETKIYYRLWARDQREGCGFLSHRCRFNRKRREASRRFLAHRTQDYPFILKLSFEFFIEINTDQTDKKIMNVLLQANCYKFIEREVTAKKSIF